MHEYRKQMERIHRPADLDARVLSAVRESPCATRKRGNVWKTAVCAACVVALMASTVPLRTGEPDTVSDRTVSFQLTAYAADLDGEDAVTVNGGVVFGGGNRSSWSEQDGNYTDCVFQVTGQGIRTLTLTLDRGELYRLHPESARTVGQRLGVSVTETYDPAVRYGFWVPAYRRQDLPEGEVGPDIQRGMDTLNGAHLTVTVDCTDGETRSRTYTLSTGRLRAVWNEDGTKTILPGLAGDDAEFFYGVYAVAEEESVWLQWPVEESRVVSLSNPYGVRTAPDGSGIFHSGIDIPGTVGTEIVAAADGTVTDAGFDPERGNYLVLDHGGGLTTLYGQCREVLVQPGNAVTGGQAVALLGATGSAVGPHLHFEVRQDGAARDPVAYFAGSLRDTLRME